MATPRLLTVRAVARNNGLSYKSILRAVRNHELRSITVGRRPLVPDGAIDEFLKARTHGPPAVNVPEDSPEEVIS